MSKHNKDIADRAIDAFFRGASVCRVSTAVWRLMLLQNMDTFTLNCCLQQVHAKSLGAGVQELSYKIKEFKEPSHE